MDELKREEQLARLKMHEIEWLRAQFDAELNREVATAIGDADMLKRAKEAEIRAAKALKVVREKVAALESE